MLAWLALVVGVAAAGPVGSPPSSKIWQDQELLAYASGDYDKRAMMNKHELLGRHKGMALVADFPCSDICPDYTVRVIHYDLAPAQTCAMAGGVERKILVPMGVAMNEKKFCFPRILVDHWDKYKK